MKLVNVTGWHQYYLKTYLLVLQHETAAYLLCKAPFIELY